MTDVENTEHENTVDNAASAGIPDDYYLEGFYCRQIECIEALDKLMGMILNAQFVGAMNLAIDICRRAAEIIVPQAKSHEERSRCILERFQNLNLAEHEFDLEPGFASLLARDINYIRIAQTVSAQCDLGHYLHSMQMQELTIVKHLRAVWSFTELLAPELEAAHISRYNELQIQRSHAKKFMDTSRFADLIDLPDFVNLANDAATRRLEKTVEKEKPTEESVTPAAAYDETWLQLVDESELRKHLGEGDPNADIKTLADRFRRKTEGNKRHFVSLYDKGCYRKLAQFQRTHFNELEALRQRFPNFEQPIKAIERAIALANSNGKPGVIAFCPILLLGEPGVGKSMFARELAQVLRVPFTKFDLGSSTSAMAISGSDVHWGNSEIGRVARMLIQGEVANPLMLLDEIEKAASQEKNAPVLPALLNLLEKNSARQFVDSHLSGLTLDASRILWMATSNRVEKLPPELLDRFQIFTIPPLNAAQMRTLIQREYVRMVEDKGLKGLVPTRLGKAIVDQLATLTTRTMFRILEQCMGEMALRDSYKITRSMVSDILAEIEQETKDANVVEGNGTEYAIDETERRPIGFIY